MHAAVVAMSAGLIRMSKRPPVRGWEVAKSHRGRSIDTEITSVRTQRCVRFHRRSSRRRVAGYCHRPQHRRMALTLPRPFRARARHDRGSRPAVNPSPSGFSFAIVVSETVSSLGSPNAVLRCAHSMPARPQPGIRRLSRCTMHDAPGKGDGVRPGAALRPRGQNPAQRQITEATRRGRTPRCLASRTPVALRRGHAGPRRVGRVVEWGAVGAAGLCASQLKGADRTESLTRNDPDSRKNRLRLSAWRNLPSLSRYGSRHDASGKIPPGWREVSPCFRQLCRPHNCPAQLA